MEMFLWDYQYEAVEHMHNGCILNGDTGTGKSRTGLYYYFKLWMNRYQIPRNDKPCGSRHHNDCEEKRQS